MSTIKVFKKGDVLIREGETAKMVYLIQSGSVSIHLARHKQTIELCVLSTHQIIGEHAISGTTVHPHTATCLTETKVIELPVDGVKSQIEGSSQLTKVLAKGLSDKLRVVLKELQSVKLERDNTPCPPDQTAKIFAALFHSAKLKMEGQHTNWRGAKQYAQRMFLESPKRLEQAANIFVKLDVAKYEWIKNEDEPDAPEEIGYIAFSDLNLVEQFFEYYQYYYFKGGKSELLKTDDRVIQLVNILIEVGATTEPDRNGFVRLEYAKVVDRVREVMGLSLNGDHFALIENKGLFVKRQSIDGGGVTLQFEYKEFERTLKVWRVLREVERWNEKGSVDPNEPVVEPKARVIGGAGECNSCHHPYIENAKFCSSCGAKLQMAA
jgi:hypothetical protein